MIPEASLLEKITDNVQVVFWIGDGPLSEDVAGFVTADYLLDGLVRSHLKSSEPWHQVNFKHRLFGKDFWLNYLDGRHPVSASSLLSGIKALIPENARSHLVIINHQWLAPELNEVLDKHFTFVERS